MAKRGRPRRVQLQRSTSARGLGANEEKVKDSEMKGDPPIKTQSEPARVSEKEGPLGDRDELIRSPYLRVTQIGAVADYECLKFGRWEHKPDGCVTGKRPGIGQIATWKKKPLSAPKLQGRDMTLANANHAPPPREIVDTGGAVGDSS
ncbi:hypothetical protein Dimus_024930 [Dionaea muscipula]